MSAPSPIGSLKPALLARKGGARPAMRSAGQLGTGDELADLAASQEALGWNDLGEDPVVVPINAATTRAAPKMRRAAFTLRLDPQRHMKLRLASAMRECSSQALVTEALDRFLDTLPHNETLTALTGQQPSDTL